MSDARPTLQTDQLSEGYSLEMGTGVVLVWHYNTQIALLMDRDNVEERARAIVERRRQELRVVEEKTGWRHPGV